MGGGGRVRLEIMSSKLNMASIAACLKILQVNRRIQSFCDEFYLPLYPDPGWGGGGGGGSPRQL